MFTVDQNVRKLYEEVSKLEEKVGKLSNIAFRKGRGEKARALAYAMHRLEEAHSSLVSATYLEK